MVYLMLEEYYSILANLEKVIEKRNEIENNLWHNLGETPNK